MVKSTHLGFLVLCLNLRVNFHSSMSHACRTRTSISAFENRAARTKAAICFYYKSAAVCKCFFCLCWMTGWAIVWTFGNEWLFAPSWFHERRPGCKCLFWCHIDIGWHCQISFHLPKELNAFIFNLILGFVSVCSRAVLTRPTLQYAVTPAPCWTSTGALIMTRSSLVDLKTALSWYGNISFFTSDV